MEHWPTSLSSLRLSIVLKGQRSVLDLSYARQGLMVTLVEPSDGRKMSIVVIYYPWNLRKPFTPNRHSWLVFNGYIVHNSNFFCWFSVLVNRSDATKRPLCWGHRHPLFFRWLGEWPVQVLWTQTPIWSNCRSLTGRGKASAIYRWWSFSPRSTSTWRVAPDAIANE